MHYRKLGKAELEVSMLGLGGTSIGDMFGKVELQEIQAMVQSAFDLGMNWLDTSPYYGLTKAETVLGMVLKEIKPPPREKMYVCSKVGRYGDAVFDFSAERVTRSVDESLARIGCDYFDVVFCHDIEFWNLDQIIHETFPALQKLKAKGKVRHIGISGYPLKIFKYILEHDKSHTVDVCLSYCHYNLQNTTLTEVLPFLKESGVGIINASPLSMGLLTQRGPPPWHPAPAQMKDLCRKAAEYCNEQHEPIEKLGNQFAFSHPDIHATLTGSGSEKEIRNNIQWLEESVQKGYNRSVTDHVQQQILAPVMNQSWLSGRPENN